MNEEGSVKWSLLVVVLALIIAESLDEKRPQLEYEVEVVEKIEDIPKPEELREQVTAPDVDPQPEELREQVTAPDVDPLTPPLKPCKIDPKKIECVLEAMEL
jgi:hypothetical protein